MQLGLLRLSRLFLYSSKRNFSSDALIFARRLKNYELFAPGLFYDTKRYKGHSHWQNIARTKTANDQARGRMISELILKMKKAVSKNKNETDPKYNRALANVLEECRVNNVTKETVTRSLERLRTQPPVQSHLFDIRGRGGIFLVLEAETPNKGKTKVTIYKICAKLGDFGPFDAVSGERPGFIERGIVTVLQDAQSINITEEGDDEDSKRPPAPPLNLSDAESLGIELECEEVVEVPADPENEKPAVFEFTCDPAQVDRVVSGLRVRGYVVLSSDVDFVPSPAPVVVTAKLKESVEKLYEKLQQEVEGVGRIFDNVDWENTAD